MRSTTPMALLAASASAHNTSVPSVEIPSCPAKGSITYTTRVPTQTNDFPETQVDLCYSSKFLHIGFTARNETNFYFDPKQGTNDEIYEYEVMEAFIYKGTDDPQTYLEFEVNPNNVTYQAFVYNPSETRADGAPFDHFFVSDPATDGFTAETKLDKEAKTWVSDVKLPLALFNVKEGQGKGTEWRMQFLRTITDKDSYPDQELGAWNPPDEANFHITKYMGKAKFV